MPAPRERFERLNATLLPQLPALVKQWLPSGRATGVEWTALNPRRHDQRPGSFRVNLRSGRWADFATGECGGDPVSLYAYLFTGGRQGAAARALDGGRIAVRPVGAADGRVRVGGSWRGHARGHVSAADRLQRDHCCRQ